MNLEEAIKALKEGKKIRRKTLEKGDYYQLDMSDKTGFIRGTPSYFTPLISFRADGILGDDWEIVEEPVLNKQGKEYLENFLRPYTKRFGKITITKAHFCGRDFSICIRFYDYKDDGDITGSLSLPYFSKNEHKYDGMEVDKSYTLDELGLFK